MVEDYEKWIKEEESETCIKSIDLPDVRIQVLNENDNSTNDVYVTINLYGLKKPITVLVDSGADISLLKYGSISNSDWIDKSKVRTIGGTFNGSSNLAER